MKRKQENYIPPCIKVIETKVEYHLLEGSNIGQGGHNSELSIRRSVVPNKAFLKRKKRKKTRRKQTDRGIFDNENKHLRFDNNEEKYFMDIRHGCPFGRLCR
ncbi:hypothetical protein [Hoylesella saccharolytica]|uniref:hypothetical protein n=1 Tax=Hoylesella saccharolytica TaxID=633701 RepID=UPI0004719155|nr:hypothetical protein [Hoylesella saccharolytica]